VVRSTKVIGKAIDKMDGVNIFSKMGIYTKEILTMVRSTVKELNFMKMAIFILVIGSKKKEVALV